MGHVPESFVIQQIITQATWTDPELRFRHYRDKDKVEVDLVITRGGKTWAVEVKAAACVNERDGKGLRRLADQAGKDFQSGIVLCGGTGAFPWDILRFSWCRCVSSGNCSVRELRDTVKIRGQYLIPTPLRQKTAGHDDYGERNDFNHAYWAASISHGYKPNACLGI